MNDHDIQERIQRLVDEEHTLLQRGEGSESHNADRDRLRSIEVALDQCWDLLRQRRARREFGMNPSEAHVRDATTVERYVQ